MAQAELAVPTALDKLREQVEQLRHGMDGQRAPQEPAHGAEAKRAKPVSASDGLQWHMGQP